MIHHLELMTPDMTDAYLSSTPRSARQPAERGRGPSSA